MKGHERWSNWLEKEMKSEYFQKILKKFEYIDKHYLVYPEKDFRLRALEFPNVEDIHIVLVGSEPDVKPYEADGLAYSSLDTASWSMMRLYRAIYNDLGVIYNQQDNRKDRWAEQGVLLLNMELTNISNRRRAHDTIWEKFTYRVLQYLLYDEQPRFFLLLDSTTKWIVLDNPYHHPLVESTIHEAGVNRVFSKACSFYRERTGRELDLS